MKEKQKKCEKQQPTNHYKNQRYKREKFINKYLGGDGYIIDGFVVDRNHKDGVEVHSITDNGIILIHNMKSGELITKLIARPQQIKRYYKDAEREDEIPCWLMELAEWHKELGYNK